jgi:hypothetical protein
MVEALIMEEVGKSTWQRHSLHFQSSQADRTGGPFCHFSGGIGSDDSPLVALQSFLREFLTRIQLRP